MLVEGDGCEVRGNTSVSHMAKTGALASVRGGGAVDEMGTATRSERWGGGWKEGCMDGRWTDVTQCIRSLWAGPAPPGDIPSILGLVASGPLSPPRRASPLPRARGLPSPQSPGAPAKTEHGGGVIRRTTSTPPRPATTSAAWMGARLPRCGATPARRDAQCSMLPTWPLGVAQWGLCTDQPRPPITCTGC